MNDKLNLICDALLFGVFGLMGLFIEKTIDIYKRFRDCFGMSNTNSKYELLLVPEFKLIFRIVGMIFLSVSLLLIYLLIKN